MPSLLATMKERALLIRKIGYVLVWVWVAVQVLLSVIARTAWFQVIFGYNSSAAHLLSTALLCLIALGVVMVVVGYLLLKSANSVNGSPEKGGESAASVQLLKDAPSERTSNFLSRGFNSLKPFRAKIIILGSLILVASVFANYAGLETTLYALSKKGLWAGAILVVLGLMLTEHAREENLGQNQFGPRTESRFSVGLVLAQILTITAPVWLTAIFPGLFFFGITPLLAIFVSFPALLSAIVTAFLPKSLSRSKRALNWVGFTIVFLVIMQVAFFFFSNQFLTREATLPSGEVVQVKTNFGVWLDEFMR